MDEKVLALETESDALRAEGKYAEAITKIEEAIAIDPNFARGYLALSVLCNYTQDYTRSCEAAEKACELEPGDQFNLSALSVTYQRAFEGTKDPAFIQKAEEAKARAAGF